MGSCRCKMCGGHIHYENDASVAICEYCGTEQTIVKTDNEKQAKLFERANTLRLENEFDKAQLTYDNILIDDPKSAEAHWGICLCRYGIEYIDAPKTKKKIPTCHRAVIKSIFDDLDYKETIANSDVVAKKVYEKEATLIDKIQKEILSISQKEEPFDVFISCKEHDENGSRTKDSFVASEIYTLLVNKGYKVFLSRVTLKDKDTSEYEPIIFAALTSSKVMLAIGSKKEYFNSVWEKNEWARFLSFMKDNREKYLFPCYIDMNQYDLPEEFMMLQSTDISKVGSSDYLVKKIDKIIGNKSSSVESINDSNKIIDRIKFCLSCRDFAKADELIELVLNKDYKCSEAYFYKVLVKNKARDINDLIKRGLDISYDDDYKKALRFANASYNEYLIKVVKDIKAGINEETKRKLYDEFNYQASRPNYKAAFDIGRKIDGYSDVDVRIEEVKDSCYKSALQYKHEKQWVKAIDLFMLCREYLDSEKQIKECKARQQQEINQHEADRLIIALSNIIDRYANKRLNYNDAYNFSTYLARLKNVAPVIYSEKYEYYHDLYGKIKKAIEKADKRDSFFSFIRANGKKIIIGCIIFVALILTVVITYRVKVINPYKRGKKLLAEYKYDEARKQFSKTSYSDSKKIIKLLDARDLLFDKKIDEAIDIVYNIGGTTNITYDGDGGTSTKTNDVIKKAKYVDASSEKPGYFFVKWKIKNFDFDFDKHTLDLELIAKYASPTYSIKYKYVSSSYTETAITTYNYGSTLSIPNPTGGTTGNSGAIFTGWTIRTSDDYVIDELQKDFVISEEVYGDLEFEANWVRYRININFNGGTYINGQTTTYTSAIYGERFSLPTPTEAPRGCKFVGYRDHTGKMITNSRGYSLDVYNYDSSITVWASWEYDK